MMANLFLLVLLFTLVLPSQPLASDLRIETPLSEREAMELFRAFIRETGIQVTWKSAPVLTTLKDLRRGVRNFDLWFGVPLHILREIVDMNIMEVGEYDSQRNPLCPPDCIEQGPSRSAIFYEAIGIAVNRDTFLSNLDPSSWLDLKRTELRGRTCLPLPEYSDTGYLMLQTYILRYGESEGFSALAAAIRNARSINKSGKSCVSQIELEESYVGAAVASDIIRNNIENGADLISILPSEGVASYANGAAVFKWTRDKDMAKRLLDWSVGSFAQEIFLRWGQIPAHNTARAGWIPKILYTPVMSGKNRNETVARWKAFCSDKCR